MKELFTIKYDGLFWVEEEGAVYSIYNCKTHTLIFYDCTGHMLSDYARTPVEEPESVKETEEYAEEEGLRFNKYGVACGDNCLVDVDGNELLGTQLNCEEDCHEQNRYFVFTLLSEEQNAAIDRCGTADGITMDYYDTKTREYILKGVPECKLDVMCFDGEPEVVMAAAQLIDQYESVCIRRKGTILGKKGGWITVYDYYQS